MGHSFSDTCIHRFSWHFFNQNLQFKVICFYWDEGIILLGRRHNSIGNFHVLLRDYKKEEGRKSQRAQ